MLDLLLLATVAIAPAAAETRSPADSSYERVAAEIRPVFDDCSVETAKAAEAHVREWAKRNPGPEAGQLVFLVSRVWFACEEYREALRVLGWLETEWKGELQGHAALGAAECWQKLGETDRMIEALERASERPPRDTHLGVMDAGNTVSAAIFRLAPLREERGEWEQALRLWERWEPRAWCGNELEAFQSERIRGIARSQVALGRVEAALDTLSSTEVDRRLNGLDRKTLSLWVRIARDAKRQDSIENILERLYLISMPADPHGQRDGIENAQLRFFASRSRLEEIAGVLLEIGDPARAWLTQRSSRGDAHAATLHAAMDGVFPAFERKEEELREGFLIPADE